MENIYLDGKPFTDQISTSPSQNYIEIEPLSGTMTLMNRTYTIVGGIKCFDSMVTDCKLYGELPFPSLDDFKNN